MLLFLCANITLVQNISNKIIILLQWGNRVADTICLRVYFWFNDYKEPPPPPQVVACFLLHMASGGTQ